MSMTFVCKSPEELEAKIQRFARVFPDGVKEALWQEGSLIMNESVEQVPVDTGYLHSTSYVNDPFEEGGKITTEMGYWANYAAPVHDIPEPPAVSKGGRSAHHDAGKAFFLSDPFEARGPNVQKNIVARVEQMLGGE